MPHLTISTPDAGAITYELENEVTTIGRTDENDLTIEDGSVSSHHARITLQPDGGMLLEDLDSTNGTKVNGESVSAIPLSGGETITFGSVDVQYVVDSASAGSGESQPPADSPAQPDAEDSGAMPAEVSKRPEDFASEAPFPKQNKKSDPAGVLAMVGGMVALLAFAGSLYLVFSMQSPFS